MKKIAFDFGASTIDCVADGVTIGSIDRIPHAESQLDALLAQFSLDRSQATISVTGGKSSLIPDVTHVSEIDAIARGGFHFVGKHLDEALVISFGSGVCMVRTDGSWNKRISGTSMGGVVIWKLLQLLCGVTTFAEARDLAAQGNPTNIHLSIDDLIGASIGGLSRDKTAVCFGKVADGYSKSDMAAAIVHMITENIGTIGVLAARQEVLSEVIVIGKGTLYPGVIDQLRKQFLTAGIHLHVPVNAAYATCLGASL